MSQWMRDYERQQFEHKMTSEAERQNELLSLQMAREESYRKEQKEKSYQDRIYQLRLALAQASDSYQREQIQLLLDEATADYEAYLEQLRKERRLSLLSL
ncbi:hypothetical protein [Streptococcus sp. E24BD]|uniref:hypothetical protein n=1 Tax=Streptococcus sp. E24BD TaxID=3278715 RepID=UPI00359E7C9A